MTLMRILFSSLACLAALTVSSTPCVKADQPTQRDIDEIRAIVEENCAAHSRGDVQGVLATIHPLAITPQERAEFKNELEDCFKDARICVRLVSLIVNNFNDPRSPGRMQMARNANISVCSATADVVQLTLPADHSYADLEEYPAELSTDFRHNSAMLPTHQLVRYTLRLDYDYKTRRWLAGKIISKVEPVKEWPDNIREVMKGEPAFTTSRQGVASGPAPR